MAGSVARQVAGYREVTAQVERLVVTVRSPDGGVAVTVRPPGVLTNLSLTDACLRRGASELARLIVATATRAQTRLARRLARQVQHQLGGRYALYAEAALPR
jgi:YbaB/EbfC DNA-binding family protein